MNNITHKSPARAPRGFTLIELLVVISVIGLLAGLIVGGLGAVQKNKYLSNARAELALLEAAIDRYHAAYGTYPPSDSINYTNIQINPLYFELSGVILATNAAGEAIYQSLDGTHSVKVKEVRDHYGVDGFVNCSKGTGDDAIKARTFLPNLKANQVAGVTNPVSADELATVIVTSVGGPDSTYQPFKVPDLNPWRYNSASPTNNPGSYDLYIQLVISGKTNLICNWSKQAIINSPLR